jgi:hypothetical protein
MKASSSQQAQGERPDLSGEQIFTSLVCKRQTATERRP